MIYKHPPPLLTAHVYLMILTYFCDDKAGMSFPYFSPRANFEYR